MTAVATIHNNTNGQPRNSALIQTASTTDEGGFIDVGDARVCRVDMNALIAANLVASHKNTETRTMLRQVAITEQFIISTDSYRLLTIDRRPRTMWDGETGIHAAACDIEVNDALLVPADLVKTAAQMVKKGRVIVTETADTVSIIAENGGVFTDRKPEGDYPRVGQLIPTPKTVETAAKGGAQRTALNPDYLADVAKVAKELGKAGGRSSGANNVRIIHIDPMKPCLFHLHDGDEDVNGALYLLMPVRMQ